jgi:hypothetical protein
MLFYLPNESSNPVALAGLNEHRIPRRPISRRLQVANLGKPSLADG